MDRRTSRILCIPLLLTGSLLLTSCFESVNNTLNNFCTNLTRGDYAKAYTDELSTSYKHQVTESAFITTAHQVLCSHAHDCIVNAPEQHDAQNSGAGVITATSASGHRRLAVIRLVHEGGDWKISMITEEE